MQFLSGLLGAVIGGVIVAWFNYLYLWKSAKKIEQMRAVFDDAMKALALCKRRARPTLTAQAGIFA